MARPRSYKTEAVVLKQMPLGEADRILTLFTPDMGKLRAVARGVRRIKSRLGGHLELLNRVSVSIAHGKSLEVVTEAEAVQTFRGLREDLQRLSRALYVAELVDAFSAEQAPNYPVYRQLVDALDRLQSAARYEPLLRYFELHLLAHSGFRPELHQCVECQVKLEPGDHVFSNERGGALCPKCRAGSDEAIIPLPLNVMKMVRFMQREKYERAVALKAAPEVWSSIELLLRSYVRYHVERELKSADFMSLVASPNRQR